MGKPKFQLYKDSQGEFRFRFNSRKRKNVLRSCQGYATKEKCQNAIVSLRLNAPFEVRYNRAMSKDGQFFFTIGAGNGKAIGISERYKSSNSRNKSLETVQDIAPRAPIEDLT